MLVDGNEVAATIHELLTEDRGRQQLAKVAFERVDEGRVDFRVILATPATTDRLCEPLDTRGELSCRVGERVVLNARRWLDGAPAYAQAVEDYRT